MKKKKFKKVHLFTNEIKVVQILKTHFSIEKLFTENKDLLKKLKKYNYKIVLVKSHKDLPKKINSLITMGISCAFGIIFKKKFLTKYTNGIWNIHLGSLPNYRGRHPITAAFLNDEKKIGLSVHILDEKIDRGFLLAKSYVKRNYSDDEISIKKKLFAISLKVLKKGIKNFRKKKLIKVTKGHYYKPFYNGINIINSKKVEYKYIFNAAKAQKSYQGINVNKKKYYDAFFYSKNALNKKNIEIVFCKKNRKIILSNQKN